MKTLLIIDANLGQARADPAGRGGAKSKTGNHRQSERR